MKGLFLTICTFLCIAVWGIYIVCGITFNVNCRGHLKRAADSNTAEMAKQELDVALSYLEKEGLTDGYTSVIYKTPDEDIGFWYSNLKAASEELGAIDSNATILEKSNALMKLRETLLDQGEKSETVTVPDGISRYPYNGILGTLMLISLLLVFIGYIIVESSY